MVQTEDHQDSLGPMEQRCDSVAEEWVVYWDSFAVEELKGYRGTMRVTGWTDLAALG